MKLYRLLGKRGRTTIPLEIREQVGFVYNDAERWRDMLRTQTQALSDAFHIPLQNLKWYAAFHNEKHHPHVHMIVYSDTPPEGFLTKAGVEQLRSSLAMDIFAQDLHNIYERQTGVRDALRALSREHIAAVIDEINADGCDNPQLELLLMQLAAALSEARGKKVYGYLDTGAKALVDEIVDELAADSRIEELYDLWYEQRQAVLQTYTDEPPERLPLSENPAFRPIKNTVIQEALRLIQDQAPHLSTKRTPGTPQNQPYALGILRLLQQLARAFEDRENEKQRTLLQMRTDRKLLQKIEEKKQAHGLKQG